MAGTGKIFCRLTALALMAACAMAAPAWSGDWKTRIIEADAPDQSGRKLPIRLLLPDDDGPFPLAVINHGSPANAADRQTMKLPEYRRLSDWLLERGYAVALPLRRGYGEAGGKWNEGYGSCDDPDFYKAGRETAKDIQAAISALSADRKLDMESVVVFGQSAGAWGTVALSSDPASTAYAYVAFAPGRGGHQGGEAKSNCRPDALVEAAGRYGKTAKGPMLWLYSENDTYFAPPLAERMRDAFRTAGGKLEMRLLPPSGKDGHYLSTNKDGEALWGPVVEAFLDEHM